MKIETKNSHLKYVDDNCHAFIDYRLAFWDQFNNPLENRQVEVFEGKEKIFDSDTDCDGVACITLIFNVATEVRKRILFVIGNEKRENFFILDQIDPQITEKITQQKQASEAQLQQKIIQQKQESLIQAQNEILERELEYKIQVESRGKKMVIDNQKYKELESSLADIIEQERKVCSQKGELLQKLNALENTEKISPEGFLESVKKGYQRFYNDGPAVRISEMVQEKQTRTLLNNALELKKLEHAQIQKVFNEIMTILTQVRPHLSGSTQSHANLLTHGFKEQIRSYHGAPTPENKQKLRAEVKSYSLETKIPGLLELLDRLI